MIAACSPHQHSARQDLNVPIYLKSWATHPTTVLAAPADDDAGARQWSSSTSSRLENVNWLYYLFYVMFVSCLFGFEQVHPGTSVATPDSENVWLAFVLSFVPGSCGVMEMGCSG